MSYNKKALFIVFCIIGLMLFTGEMNKVDAGPMPQQGWMTLSGRVVILSGGKSDTIEFEMPECPDNLEVLVLGVYVGPEVSVGNTNRDVLELPNWAVSVPLYQRYSGSGTTHIKVPFTLLAKGPEHVSAMLPSGQGLGVLMGDLPVTITLLGGVSASRRFEFNVHLIYSYGKASTIPTN